MVGVMYPILVLISFRKPESKDGQEVSVSVEKKSPGRSLANVFVAYGLHGFYSSMGQGCFFSNSALLDRVRR